MSPQSPPPTWRQFSAQRLPFNTQLFRHPPDASSPPRRTIMLCSHIWWTEHIAFSLFNLGYDVLVHAPLYLVYIDPAGAPLFEQFWNATIALIRAARVDLIIGGNSTAILMHPKTGQLLHEVAGPDNQAVPLVNWWWDEPRNLPPFAMFKASPGMESVPVSQPYISPQDYLNILRGPHVHNAIWDIDVLEELRAQFNLQNLFHLPLATLPEFWPQEQVPLENRPLHACFLGNCHFDARWVESDNDPLIGWAREIALAKIASPDTPMQACADSVTRAKGGIPANSGALGDGDPWLAFTRPWELVNAAYMHFTRNNLVLAAEKHLKGKLALIGKGWEALGLRANMTHAEDKTGHIYAQSKISLNLFGGCVHGGMPLRPYDITACQGLLLTHYQRELPSLFSEPAHCLSFRNEQQMLTHIDDILTTPQRYHTLPSAAHDHTLAHHTWAHRLNHLLAQVSGPVTAAPSSAHQ